MVKAKEAEEAVGKFTKKIAGTINRATIEVRSKGICASKPDITEEDLLTIWDEGHPIKDGSYCLGEPLNLSDKDLKDFTEYFKNDYDEYLADVIKASTGIVKGAKIFKEIYNEIKKEITDSLNLEWQTEFKLSKYKNKGLPGGEIIAFYFLHSFKNQITRAKIYPVKDVDYPAAEEQRELVHLLDEHNFVLFQGLSTSWRMMFLDWFSRQEGRSYKVIEWEEGMEDLKSVLAAVPSREKEIMEELHFKMRFYSGSNNTENLIECFENICFPDKFILIIDGFDGSGSLLKKLRTFAEENGGTDKFQIIILPLYCYDEFEPVFHIGLPNEECLKRIFEKYSGISLEDNKKTAALVDRLCEKVSDNPEMMVLFAEAFKKQMEKEDIESAVKLLKQYLDPLDKEADNEETVDKEEDHKRGKNRDDGYKFHSDLDSSELKLSGHIKSIYEKYLSLKKGTLVVLSCIRDISIPEDLVSNWFDINSDDLKKMQSIGWCRKNDNIITINVPLILTRALVTNEDERKEAKDALGEFLKKIEREIRNARPDSIDAKMLDDIVKKILDLPNFWLTNLDKKDIDQYSQEIQMFGIYCIRHAVQCGKIKFAKELIEFKGDETFSNSTVGKAWKCIIDLNGLKMDDNFDFFVKEWTEFENRYLKPLTDKEHADLKKLSYEELLSYIEITQENIEILLTCIMYKCLKNGLEATDSDLNVLNVIYTYAGLKEDLEEEVNERNDYTGQEDDCFKPMIEILKKYYENRTLIDPVSLIEGLGKQLNRIKWVMDGYWFRDQKLLRREEIKKVNLFCDFCFILLLFTKGCPKFYYEGSPNLYSNWIYSNWITMRMDIDGFLCKISEAYDLYKKFLPRISLSKIAIVEDIYDKYIEGSRCPWRACPQKFSGLCLLND